MSDRASHAGGPLPDGNYRVTLDGAGVSNATGVAIGAMTALDFYAFAGDANRDRTVDFNDLVKLAQNYNTRFGSPAAMAGASAEFDRDVAAAFATVPEPGGVVAVLAMAVAGGRRRRAMPS